MKKNLLLFLLLLPVLFLSCKKDNSQANVTVNVVNIDAIDADKATPSSVADVKSITVVFFKHSDHSIQWQSVQRRQDFADSVALANNFGTFNVQLPVGAYDLVVLGYGDTIPATVSSFTSIQMANSRMTFLALQTVNISNASHGTINVELSRISTQLRFVTTDTVPSGVNTVRITLSGGGKDLNPSTGLANTNTGIVSNVTGFPGRVGQRPQIYCNTLLCADEQTMDVVVEVLDANGQVLIAHNLTDVPFKRNRRTVLTGTLYHHTPGTGITVNTDWLTDYNGTF